MENFSQMEVSNSIQELAMNFFGDDTLKETKNKCTLSPMQSQTSHLPSINFSSNLTDNSNNSTQENARETERKRQSTFQPPTKKMCVPQFSRPAPKPLFPLKSITNTKEIPQCRIQPLFCTPFRKDENDAKKYIVSNADKSDHSVLTKPSYSPQPLSLNCGLQKNIHLKSVMEIPEPYRQIFSDFPYFNVVQSKVFDDVVYTDKSIVVCAPTGSGKTVIFQLAIIRLLIQHCSNLNDSSFKIVYMAPIKALCSEKYNEWRSRFEPLGISCTELTGDTEGDEYFHIQQSHIVLTTPEKWDSFTRRWRDNKSLVQLVRLFLIDEVHILNDNIRGPTLEAVVSRMKTIQTTLCRNSPCIRFLAVSATIPNVEDIAQWLQINDSPALSFKVDDNMRPVKLQKVVLGYPCTENMSEFKFDLNLNYKLDNIIQIYSKGRPTLIFCSTRKGVVQAAVILAKSMKYMFGLDQKNTLRLISSMIKDNKLKDVIQNGVGFHHAGLETSDRRLIEESFSKGEIPVLSATSTLAMGVNLPAHLVIIKSTVQYLSGSYTEYSETQILQMIGRAGRPQFDTTATAVIMTKSSLKHKYESLITGTQFIESNLHNHLIEHLNAEIVLHTINDVSVAMEWIKSTFLYIRCLKNPKHYGIQEGLTKDQIENKLSEICMKDLNALTKNNFIQMSDDGFDLKPTDIGRMMARYCMKFETIKLFTRLQGLESINDLIGIISSCMEFSDIQLRVNERRILNVLNKDKHGATIRFPLDGRIKTREMKINCLIQAVFGCIPIQDPSLNQETMKIIRIGQRVTNCLVDYVNLRSEYKLLLNATILAKCFRAKLWENSKHVSKQLEKIGITLANILVNAGLTSFQKIEETNPRELEMFINRNPPFGNVILDTVSRLPKYELTFEQVPKYTLTSAEITVTVILVNWQTLVEKSKSGKNYTSVLIIGNTDNQVIFKQKITKGMLIKSGQWNKKIEVKKTNNRHEIYLNLISEELVGVDIQTTFTPFYIGKMQTIARNLQVSTSVSHSKEAKYLPCVQNVDNPESSDDSIEEFPSNLHVNSTSSLRKCNHRCSDKKSCAHACCKTGVIVKSKKGTTENGQQLINTFVNELYQKASTILPAYKPAAKPLSLKKFVYSPQVKEKAASQSTLRNLPAIGEWNRLDHTQRPQNINKDPYDGKDHTYENDEYEINPYDFNEFENFAVEENENLTPTQIYEPTESDDDFAGFLVYEGKEINNANENEIVLEDCQEIDNLPSTQDIDLPMWDLGIEEMLSSPELEMCAPPFAATTSPIKYRENVKPFPPQKFIPTQSLGNVSQKDTPISLVNDLYVKNKQGCLQDDKVKTPPVQELKNNHSVTTVISPSPLPSTRVNIPESLLLSQEPNDPKKREELRETLEMFHNMFDSIF